MSLTNLTAIDRVLSRLNETGGPVILPADVLPLIPDSLKKFAQLVASMPESRQLLRKDFSVTITSGTGSLAASLAATEPLLAEFLPSAYVVTATGVQLHYLPDRMQLTFARPTQIGYFTNDEGTIRTRNVSDGSLTSLSTILTITAQFVPTVGDVPSQLEDLYLDTLEKMIKGRVSVAQPSVEATA